MIPSRKTRESIKTALAMTIAYGIALSLDWDRPYWAAFAVIFVSLATIGQSLNKAALRMVGTLVGTGIALLLIAMFAQERWLFILSLTAWIALCTYMMGGSRHQYFWHVCGFVCTVICMDAGPDPVNAFDTAILRAEETALGILVYSLVSLLLWPVSSRAGFEASVTRLASTQQQLFQANLDLLKGNTGAGAMQSLRTQLIQQQLHFSQLLDAAQGDSYVIREQRQAWRQYRAQALELGDTLERFHDGTTELQALDLPQLLPGIKSFGDALDLRFTRIQHLLASQAPVQQPAEVRLQVNEAAVRDLPHFHRAALLVSLKQLKQIESLTRALVDSISVIRGDTPVASEPPKTERAPACRVPDPERMIATVRVMLIVWLTWLAILYVNGIPGSTGLLNLGVPIGMILATMPQLTVWQVFRPAMTGVLFAGVLYIFLMPGLSGFSELGLLIFAATFTICYLFAEPQQMLGRAFGLVMFVVIADISNQQTYSFLGVANTAMMMPIIFSIFAITAYIPWSPRPERAVLRLLGRFFRSSEYLLSTMQYDPDPSPTRTDRRKTAFHTRELATLPQKLGAWAGHIDTGALPGTSREQVQSLASSLQVLGYRIQELLEVRDHPQAPVLVQALLTDFRDWRLRVQKTFQRLSEDPAAGDQETFRARLDEIMQHLETRVHAVLDRTPDDRLGASDDEHFYRLLGAYRGVSEALVEYAGRAGKIDLSTWREERFA